MKMSGFVVTIDGPAGAGKSSVARVLAQRMDFTYLESGALYRAVALAASRAGLAMDDVEALGCLAASSGIDLRFQAGGLKVFLGGQEVTDELRAEEIGDQASAISRLPAVRKQLNHLQRRLAAARRVVVEGRDAGTVVFPQAQAKFFLTASLEERARRRVAQLAERGLEADLEAVARQMAARDAQDESRSAAPLRPAKTAQIVDTTALSLKEVVGLLAGQIAARLEEARTRP